MNRKSFLALAVLGIILVAGCVQQGQTSQGVTVVRGAGGQAMLDGKCANEAYVNEISDYVVKGKITNVESKWNSDKTKIFTYTDIYIDEYAKGERFESNKLQIVTPGGCADGICSDVEDQPTFTKGDFVQVRFHKSGDEYVVVCGFNGVSKIP